jgi:flavin-dependent dehydrogenase
MTDRKRVQIAGAGPSGLTAGINLALAGFDVHVYEKRSDTGMRFHGDLQGLENWSNPTNVLQELAEMNVQVNFDCDPYLMQVITNGKATRTARYPADKPLCYLVKRGAMAGSLDQGLKEQALAAGVVIHFKETIPLEEADIVATGPISKELFAVDKGIVFETDAEDLNVFLINDEVAYKGYSYLLITKGYGCLCTVLFDRFKQLDACFEASLRAFQENFDFEIRDPRPVAGVGCFSTRNIFREGKSLNVGEAAGLQDLLWGFGIRSAMQSGYLAAQSIIQGQDYEQEAQKRFSGRQKATLNGRFLWELARMRDYGLVVSERFSRGTARGFDLSFLYNFSTLHKLVYPIAVTAMRRRYPHLRL